MNFFKLYKGHYASILKLGIPVVIGQLGQILLGFADNIMIGHYNAESLAAASFVNNLFNLPILFGLGFSYGLTPIISGLLAKNNFPEMGSYLKNSLFVNLLAAIVMIIVMSILLLNVSSLNQPKELIPLITPYFVIQIISLIFIMLFNSLKQFSEGIMDTQTPMWVMLICQILNIMGNYLLIYGKLGLPEMGLTGAGISTLLSRIVMMGLLCYFFFSKKSYFHYRNAFKKSILNKFHIRNLNKMGIFIGLQIGMETGMFSLSTIMMGWLGIYALAAHQIACTVTTIGFMVYYGIGAAIAIRISNFAGKDEWINVKRATIAGFHIIMIFVLVASTILILLRNQIGYLFVNNVNIVSLVATIMIPVILYQFGDGLQVCFANALRALKDVKAMALISFIGYFLIALPCCYFFGFILGMKEFGIWLGFPVGLTLTGILFMLRFRFVIKKQAFL